MKSRKRSVGLAIGIFTIAFLPRFLDLGTEVVADEQIWINRSISFIKAIIDSKYAETAISGHPGVITMWLGGISIGFAKVMFGFKQTAHLLFWAQLPFAIIFSTITVIIFFLLRNLFNTKIALIACFLIATDPFLIAFSRIIHLDAVLTSFMTLGLLSILLYTRDRNLKYYLIISGFLSGIAIIAKIPGLFLLLFTGFALIIHSIFEYYQSQNTIWNGSKSLFLSCLIWFFFGVAAMYLLWPAMWVDPFYLLKILASGPGLTPHEHGQFFMGKSLDDPGALYYATVALFRVTPITMIFFFMTFFVALSKLIRRFRVLPKTDIDILLLISYVILFLIFMSFGAKKVGRYILPIFPVLDIIAAIGIVIFLDLLGKKLDQKYNFFTYFGMAFLILSFQLVPLLKIHPYYLSYYNPLLGGPKRAEKMILIGRGEGMSLIADYFNNKANANSLTVATEFAYLLGVHFKGKVKDTKIEVYDPDTLKVSDYLVVYISGLQKQQARIPEEVLKYHNENEPEHILVLNKLNYAYIYKL